MIKFTLQLLAALLLLATTSNGQNFAWAHGIDTAHGEFIAFDKNENMYVAGHFIGTVDFDPGAGVANVASSPIYIAKYDSVGNHIWSKGLAIPQTVLGATGHFAIDTLGNIYISGQFTGTVDFDPGAGVANLVALSNLFQPDLFVLKLDSNGDYVWAKNIGKSVGASGSSFILESDIAVDPSGNVIVTGKFTGSIDFDPSPSIAMIIGVTNDVFVFKLDASGNYLWSKSISGLSDQSATCLSIDNIGNVILAGTYKGTTDFDPGIGIVNLTSTSTTYGNVFLLKLGFDGSFIWIKDLGDGSNVKINDTDLDDSGNIHLTGRFMNMCDFDPGGGVVNLTPTGLSDIFILKLSATGSYLWVKSFGNGTFLGLDYFDEGQSIAVNADGDIFTTGKFVDTVDFDPSSNVVNLIADGVYQIFVLKLNYEGNYVWAVDVGSNSYNGNDDESGYSIDCRANGTVGIVGDYQVDADFDPGAGVNMLYAGVNTWGAVYRDCAFFLNLKCSTHDTLLQTVCDSLIFNGNTYTISGIYPNVFVNHNGCDSTVVLNLTLTNSTINPLITASYCDSAVINGLTYFTSGQYTQAYSNAIGCDSLITYDLTINTSSLSELVEVSCGAFIYNNENYTSSGLYEIPFVNAQGCDSIIKLNLTINQPPQAIVTKVGTTLIANVSNNYQWLDCIGNVIIPNATEQTYQPTSNGNYAVIISNGQCSDTSDCVTVDGLTEIFTPSIHALRFKMYPNPTTGSIYIEYEENLMHLDFRLINMLGQTVIANYNLNGSKWSIDLAELSQGIYYLELWNYGTRTVFKVQKDN